MKVITYTIISFTLITLLNCSLLQPKPFGKTASFQGSSDSTSISLNTIDNQPTYELFFLLLRDEEQLSITCEGVTSNIIEKDVSIQVFLVVEKLYEKSSSANSYSSYIELGKNHDDSFTYQPNSVIATSETPLTALTQGIYRLRITIFDDRSFNYSILLRTTQKMAIFSGSIGTLKEHLQKIQQKELKE